MTQLQIEVEGCDTVTASESDGAFEFPRLNALDLVILDYRGNRLADAQAHATQLDIRPADLRSRLLNEFRYSFDESVRITQEILSM